MAALFINHATVPLLRFGGAFFVPRGWSGPLATQEGLCVIEAWNGPDRPYVYAPAPRKYLTWVGVRLIAPCPPHASVEMQETSHRHGRTKACLFGPRLMVRLTALQRDTGTACTTAKLGKRTSCLDCPSVAFPVLPCRLSRNAQPAVPLWDNGQATMTAILQMNISRGRIFPNWCARDQHSG